MDCDGQKAGSKDALIGPLGGPSSYRPLSGRYLNLTVPLDLRLLLARSSRRKRNAPSAVRLFCFLTGMVFQQPPPLLLLDSYYLFLLLVMCPESAKIWLVMCPESAKVGRFYVSRKRVENSLESHRPVETALTGPLTAAPQPGRGTPPRDRNDAPGPDLGGVNGPLASRDGLSSVGSDGTGGISGTMDVRRPLACAERRARTASRMPPREHPGLGP